MRAKTVRLRDTCGMVEWDPTQRKIEKALISDQTFAFTNEVASRHYITLMQIRIIFST